MTKKVKKENVSRKPYLPQDQNVDIKQIVDEILEIKRESEG